MKKILCTIQQDQFTDAQIGQLEALLRRHYAEHVSTAKAAVVWCVVPPGQAYTDYQVSQSSIVTMECENNFPQEKRIALLQACEKDWLAITGQHPDHLMLSLVEEALFSVFVKSNQNRLSPLGRIKFVWHMLSSLFSSKFSKGYLAFNPNL